MFYYFKAVQSENTYWHSSFFFFLNKTVLSLENRFDFSRSQQSSQTPVLNDDVLIKAWRSYGRRLLIDVLLKRTMHFSTVVRNIGVPADLGGGDLLARKIYANA